MIAFVVAIALVGAFLLLRRKPRRVQRRRRNEARYKRRRRYKRALRRGMKPFGATWKAWAKTNLRR